MTEIDNLDNTGKTGKKIFMKNIFACFAVGLLAALDQFAKFVVTSGFELHESKTLIKGVFSITYIRNEGIAWGMFQGGRVFFLIIAVIVLTACFYVYEKIVDEKKLAPIKYSLIFVMAGSIGNMIDRIKLGYVVDFLYFELINFPVFNIADIYVTVSMIFLIILVCFVYKEEDFDVIFKG